MKNIELCLKHRLSGGRLTVDEDVTNRPGIQIVKHKNDSNKKILLIGCCEKDSRNAMKETIDCLIAQSRYHIDFYNLALSWCIPQCVDMAEYDGLIFHYTIGENMFIFPQLVQHMLPALKDYHGVKVLFRQDENLWKNAGASADIIQKYAFDLVVTICNESLQERIYQKSRMPNVRFMQYLTGYISDRLKSLPYTVDSLRTIDVGYRARKNSLICGRLTFEKYDITNKFLKYAKDKNLKIDVSNRIEDTIYGDAWLSFLGNCKIVLGTESGGSIIDTTGEAEQAYKLFLEAYPNATDEQILEALQPFESDVWYNAISPRHFEAAACFSLQLMYEGEYQGIFHPYRHYLPLKKDWSNIDELMEIAMNPHRRREIVECAYEEIVQNPLYSFDHFVQKFDMQLANIFAEKA